MNLNYLIDFRKQNYANATAFAKEIGCPQSTYYYVETGKTELSSGYLKKIVELHPDFDVYQFLGCNSPITKANDLEKENQDLKIKLEKLTFYKDKLLDILLEKE